MIDPHAEQKYAQLRYMQRLATALFGAMLVLLALSASFKTTFPWLQWVQAFAAAATVGAIADWFAVVALFRHPLGLPFPHTAIVPANKNRLGASLGHFVEHNFLTAENVIRELKRRNLTMAVAAWLADQGNVHKVAERVCSVIPAALKTLGDKDFRLFFDRAIAPQMRKLNVASIAGDILKVFTTERRHQALLDRTMHEIEAWLVANQVIIKEKFGKASKFTPGILDNYIVNKFVVAIVAMLHEIASDSDHPIRRQFDEFTDELIYKLKNSADYRDQAEALMREFLDHVAREDYYAIVLTDVKRQVLADLDNDDSLIRAYVADAISKLASVLLVDRTVQTRLNAWLLQTIEALLSQHAHRVSGLIAEVVSGWDASKVGEKLELEIGKDLQYIRINGTLVGGTVGLLMHAIIGVL